MNETHNKNKENRQFLLRWIFRFFMALSCLVFCLLIIFSAVSYFTGFSLFFSKTYGWDAVVSTFLIYGLLFWPLFLVCFLILAAGFIYFFFTKKNFDRATEIAYGKALLKRMAIPFIVVLVLAGMIMAGSYFVSSTYPGACLRVKLGHVRDAYDIRTGRYFFDDEELFIAEKDDEMICFAGELSEEDAFDFLDDLYYVRSTFGKGVKLPDMTGASEYILRDRDGIFIIRFLVKGDYVIADQSGSDEFYGYFLRKIH